MTLSRETMLERLYRIIRDIWMKISEKWAIFNIAPLQYDYIISLYGLTDEADAI